MKISSILLSGLFVGTAAALIAILFAPAEGEKTRKAIAEKGNEYKDYFIDKVDSATHPFEDVHDQTIRLSKKAISRAEKLKEEAMQKMTD